MNDHISVIVSQYDIVQPFMWMKRVIIQLCVEPTSKVAFSDGVDNGATIYPGPLFTKKHRLFGIGSRQTVLDW